jgi:hypothetical protein
MSYYKNRSSESTYRELAPAVTDQAGQSTVNYGKSFSSVAFGVT